MRKILKFSLIFFFLSNDFDILENVSNLAFASVSILLPTVFDILLLLLLLLEDLTGILEDSTFCCKSVRLPN
jgi:hypothetical protein